MGYAPFSFFDVQPDKAEYTLQRPAVTKRVNERTRRANSQWLFGGENRKRDKVANTPGGPIAVET